MKKTHILQFFQRWKEGIDMVILEETDGLQSQLLDVFVVRSYEGQRAFEEKGLVFDVFQCIETCENPHEIKQLSVEDLLVFLELCIILRVLPLLD